MHTGIHAHVHDIEVSNYHIPGYKISKLYNYILVQYTY